MKNKVSTLSPSEAFKKVEFGAAIIVDIREPDEYIRKHIDGAISWPLSKWQAGSKIAVDDGKSVIFACRSGMRTSASCQSMAADLTQNAFALEGGLDAWTNAGLPYIQNRNAPLEMMRQVQIAAGVLIILGVLLGTYLNSGFYALSAFVGAGLIFAGVSGFCGMARLLALAPWNRVAA